MKNYFFKWMLFRFLGTVIAFSYFFSPFNSVPAYAADDEILVKYFDIYKGRIAFTYIKEHEKRKIYILDFSTLVAKPFAAPCGNSNVESPRFSPDGERIVFVCDRTGSNEIYSAKIDGSDMVQLTSGKGVADSPDWSPDGKKVVFTAQLSSGSGLFVVNSNGSGLEALAKTSKQYSQPRWSPTNDEILFVTNEYWPGTDLLSYSFATRKISVLTTGSVSASSPAWVPRVTYGQYAYVFGPAEDPDIWGLRRDLSGKATPVITKAGPTAVITRPGKQVDPEWIPYGWQLFFAGEIPKDSGHYELFLYDGLTKNIFQVTESRGSIRNISWSPPRASDAKTSPQNRTAPGESSSKAASPTTGHPPTSPPPSTGKSKSKPSPSLRRGEAAVR